MIKQDENGNYYLDIREEQARSAEKFAKTKEAFDAIDKSVKIVFEYGKKVEEIRRKNLEVYYSAVKKKLDEFKDDTKMLEFLFYEKGKINSKIIEANIKRDKGEKIYFESAINIIIDPLIEHYKNWLSFKKTIPELNKPNSPEISLQEKNENIQDKSEIPDLDSKQEAPDSLFTKEEIAIELPKEFQQIDCKANKEEIVSYFMRLVNKKNEVNGKPYMNEADVVKLLNNNFKIFNCKPIFQYFPINLTARQKGQLRYFVYDFYNKFTCNTQDKIRYAYFLIHNFELFKNDSLTIVMSNMGETKKPIEKNII
jgi:hypothetical protein